MDIRVLRYFLSVAQTGNISNSAKILHISQPTISRQIKQLEKEIGAHLFNRENGKMSLTEVGTYLAEQANRIVNLTDKTMANLTSMSALTGLITIGGAESNHMRTVAKVISVVTSAYPDVHFKIKSMAAESMLSELDDGILDFGIIMGNFDSNYFDFISLPGSGEWGILAKKNSKLGQLDCINSKDIEAVPLIIPQQHESQTLLAQWNKESLDKRNIVATYNLLYNASFLVSEDVGYALCVSGIVNTHNTDFVFRPLAPKLESPVHLIWQKNQSLSSAAEFFLKQLRAVIKS